MEGCVNGANQTGQNEKRITEETTETGKRKQQRGKAKGGHPTQQTPW